MKAGSLRLSLRMGLRLLWRELRAGELTVLLFSLLVAVAAMSSVAFFSARIDGALTRQASQLLAADLVVNGREPAPLDWQRQAEAGGLRTARSATFPSMVFARDQATLVTLKAVSDGYPLRGNVQLRTAAGVRQGALHPAPGEAWADSRLLQKLGLQLGDELRVGQRRLRLSGELLREPDGAVDLYNFVPRVLLNLGDLPASGLVQEGSRIRYRLFMAGEAPAVAVMQQWLAPRLPAGSRLEDIEEARPEVRSALEKARRFLGLSAVLSVTLAAAAVALAVRRYLNRHWQSVAMLRAFGQTSAEVATVWGSLLLWLALLGGGLGTLAGYGVQALLISLARQWLGEGLPAPGLLAWLSGPLSALILLAGFALPPLLALRKVPALAVLRADLPRRGSSLLAPLLALLALLSLAAWQVGDATLAVWLLAALFGFLAVVALLAWALVWLLGRYAGGSQSGWRHGLTNLARRPALAVLQVVALAVSLMALLTLTVVRDDLIGAWQRSLPPDAPDTFLINLQPPQRAALAGLFTRVGRTPPQMLPMTRARLLSINTRQVRPQDYPNDRARRLVEREFNLSWRDALDASNHISAGQWWPAGSRQPQFSVEAGLAQTVGIRLGDMLSFDVAGTRYQARVTSLRKVAWDSFQPNFFVLGPPGWLGQENASYIASYRAPDAGFNNRLVAALPNVTVIDISVIVREVRGVIERLALAVEAMFALTLLAGILVLWAALSTTRHERLADAALLRALGASRAQVRSVLLAELGALGALAGLLAGIGAMAVGSVVAVKLFDLPFAPNWLLPIMGLAAGALLVVLAASPLLKTISRTSPVEVLRGV
ncbi:ABC transporter permease [Vogesella sp. LIG4]|uniref:ABC transporter permease n=1 Tax=Vogesella sp. LIG4 TaxID=1192162 RepID=UPI00081F95A2|nr:FtsX-like permease family protein [Vogesella sp. LIG4]SCK06708.1 putative ABC transport system permease protein [Vogesella sp. LIG4]